MDNILKIIIFLKKIYILYFLAHIHTKDTNFIFGTLHTQYRYTQTNGHCCVLNELILILKPDFSSKQMNNSSAITEKTQCIVKL